MSASLTRVIVSIGDDIDVLPTSDHLEALQLQAAVRRAFARPQIVLVAVPGADEMNFLLGEFLPDPGAVRSQDVLDLMHEQALAGRPALMPAQIFVCIELALPMKDADLATVVLDDATFAIRKLRNAGNENFGHRKSMARTA